MEFELSEEQRMIQRQIRNLCEEFDDEYWREKDLNHEFPDEFFNEFANSGLCGLTVPEEYGGGGYGVLEATIVQQEVCRSGAAMAGASTISHYVHSAAPLVEFGSDDLKNRYLPKIVDGKTHLAVGVTEPNAGMDTSRLDTFADKKMDEYIVNGQKLWTSQAQIADTIMLLVRTSPRDESQPFEGLTLFFTDFDKDMNTVDVSEIPKAGRAAVDSNEVWFDDFKIPVENRIGEEGKGFEYLFSFANAERIVYAASALGVGQAAIDRACQYARDREVFDNKIGSYQGIQHPLADCWSKLEILKTAIQKAAWLYDNGQSCGPESNAVNLRSSEAAVEATERAIRTLGGLGYSREYDVERYWREAAMTLLAPITGEMIKNYIAQHVLDLPRSY